MTFKPVDKDCVASLAKGLAVIECFSEKHPQLTVSQVAEMVGITRAGARRALLTLVSLGYAEYDGKFFRLTIRTARLGHAFLSSTSTPRILQSYLERLHQKTLHSCAAATLDDKEIVHIAWAGPNGAQSVNMSVGTRLPAYCTSLGRVLLGGLKSDILHQRLEESLRPQMTAKTVTDTLDLKELIAKARVDGYSLVDGELEVGLIALAVPIFNASRQIVAAVNISARDTKIDQTQFIEKFLPPLQELQNSVSFLVH